MSSSLEQLLIIDHNQAFGGMVWPSTDFNIFWYSASADSVANIDMSKWKHYIKKTNMPKGRLMNFREFAMIKYDQKETYVPHYIIVSME